jgi:hypothetical protein
MGISLLIHCYDSSKKYVFNLCKNYELSVLEYSLAERQHFPNDNWQVDGSDVMELTRGLISCYQSFAPMADIAVALPMFTYGQNWRYYNFVLLNSMLKYVINRLMHAFFHIGIVIIPRPISTLGLKPVTWYNEIDIQGRRMMWQLLHSLYSLHVTWYNEIDMQGRRMMWQLLHSLY